jgi:hypothetical protein
VNDPFLAFILIIVLDAGARAPLLFATLNVLFDPRDDIFHGFPWPIRIFFAYL